MERTEAHVTYGHVPTRLYGEIFEAASNSIMATVGKVHISHHYLPYQRVCPPPTIDHTACSHPLRI